MRYSGVSPRCHNVLDSVYTVMCLGKQEADEQVVSTTVNAEWKNVPDTSHVTPGDVSLDCPSDEEGDDDIAYQRIKVR